MGNSDTAGEFYGKIVSLYMNLKYVTKRLKSLR